jgi:hypothetical protein
MRPALGPPRAAAALALAVLGLLVVVALASHGALHGSLSGHFRPQRPPGTALRPSTAPVPHGGGAGGAGRLPAWLAYVGLAIVAAAVLALIAVYVRVRRPAARGLAFAAPAEAAVADPDEDVAGVQAQLREIVDRSLAELRADPNARRAIIGVYHLMEGALARAGLPRTPSEAPREYLARALGAAAVGPDAPRRLTALFERARFGGVELDLGLRDEAIDALLALREQLAR